MVDELTPASVGPTVTPRLTSLAIGVIRSLANSSPSTVENPSSMPPPFTVRGMRTSTSTSARRIAGGGKTHTSAAAAVGPPPVISESNERGGEVLASRPKP
jgi:hypothetical protein